MKKITHTHFLMTQITVKLKGHELSPDSDASDLLGFGERERELFLPTVLSFAAKIYKKLFSQNHFFKCSEQHGTL